MLNIIIVHLISKKRRIPFTLHRATTVVSVPFNNVTAEATPQNKAFANCVRTSQLWASWGKGERKEESEPIGPYGFPMYNDKYNPKLLPKIDHTCTAYSLFHDFYINPFWIIDSSVYIIC